MLGLGAAWSLAFVLTLALIMKGGGAGGEVDGAPTGLAVRPPQSREGLKGA
jgi:hypothetical protein